MVRSKHCTNTKLICYFVTTLISAAIILAIIVATTTTPSSSAEPPNDNRKSIWSYKCENNKCVQHLIVETSPLLPNESFMKCHQFCNAANGPMVPSVWPMVRSFNERPPQQSEQSNAVRLKYLGWYFRINNSRNANMEFWLTNEKLFQDKILSKIPKHIRLSSSNLDYNTIEINIYVQDNGAQSKLTMNTNEAYHLNCTKLDNQIIEINIQANTMFGARHALETLTQLIYYDDIEIDLFIRIDYEIEDEPVFKHRGISLDTSRNYYSIESIKRTIDAMSFVKLNVFHWHITDSHSFPMVIRSHPDLSKYGAYSLNEIYSSETIEDLIVYATHRGVRILPEYDAPAHVGEGWQYSDDYVNLTTCFRFQPWTQYCYEPPCGQFNPSVNKLYDILEDIYRDMMEMFYSPDVFHMGGDEVNFDCWRSSENLTTWMTENDYDIESDDDFLKLWSYFQENALQRLQTVAKNDDIKVILWTNSLTESPMVDTYLDVNKYIIQVWSAKNDEHIPPLLEKGYEIILSNYDIMYLDCGFGGWTGTGNNWCSPYTGWEQIYNNTFTEFEQYISQIIGSEVALWSEQTDEHTLDAKMWPRAIALAERVWSNPTSSWRNAEQRMLLQRERYIELGIAAENIQPKWCLQNEGECPTDD